MMETTIMTMNEIISKYQPLWGSWEEWFNSDNEREIEHVKRLATEIQHGEHFEYPIVVFDSFYDEEEEKEIQAYVDSGMYRLRAYHMLGRNDIEVIQNPYDDIPMINDNLVVITYAINNDTNVENIYDWITDNIFDHLSFKYEDDKLSTWIYPAIHSYNEKTNTGEFSLLGEELDKANPEKIYQKIQEIIDTENVLIMNSVAIENWREYKEKTIAIYNVSEL